jgi:hypothetical protein
MRAQLGGQMELVEELDARGRLLFLTAYLGKLAERAKSGECWVESQGDEEEPGTDTVVKTSKDHIHFSSDSDDDSG